MARSQSGAAASSAESVAERPPRSGAVALLGFVVVVLLVAAFTWSVVRKKPANVPDGLIGLRFGMTEAEVKASLPGLRADGAAWVGRARVFDEPASCKLQLACGLSRIDCAIDRPASAIEHERVERRILATLRELYGDESEWKRAGSQEWIWHGKKAQMRLVSGPAPGLELRLENRLAPAGSR